MKIKDVLEWIFTGIVLIWFFVMLMLIEGWLIGLLGSQYKSFGSLVVFMISSEIFGLPMELFSNTVINLMYHYEHINMAWSRILYLVLSISSSIVSMAIVDYFMDSIYLTALSMLLIAIVSSLFGLFTIGIDLDDDS